jgi:DNA modification methylase
MNQGMIIQKIRVSEINPAKYNPRKDLKPGDPEYEKLKKSIQEFGLVEPLVMNRRGNVLISGHQRLKILIGQGHAETEVSVVDLAPERERALNIALNKISGEWDLPKLEELLKSLDDDLKDITGFDAEEIDELLGLKEEVKEDNFDEEVPVESITQPGTLWFLGRHRLLCGDSTDIEVVEKLMAGEKANCVITSPPYAMQRKDDYGGIPPDDYPDWFSIVAQNVYQVLDDSGSFFVNIKEHVEKGQRSLYVFKTIIALVEAGWRYVDQLIWTKTGLPGGWPNRLRNDFEPVHFFTKKEEIDWMVQLVEVDEERLKTLPVDLVDMYEDIFHFTRSEKIKFKPRNVGKMSDKIRVSSKTNKSKGRSGNISVSGKFKKGIARAGNVLQISGNQEALKHSAVFPVKLPAFFIKLTTDVGDIIYEPFNGSGTSLMAAEQLGRNCYAMELSPGYCDLTVKRLYQYNPNIEIKLNGKPVDAGQLFEEPRY